MSQGRTLHRRRWRWRWRWRRRTHRRPAGSHARTAQDSDSGRVHRYRDALFVGHDRTAEGHLAAAARPTADAAAADLRLPAKTLAVPRRHDLSVAGAAVS